MITDPVQVDEVSGQTTTGHEWDGIRELNTPLPRWWLWLFYLMHRFRGRLIGSSIPPGRWPAATFPVCSVRPTARGSLRISPRGRRRACSSRPASRRPPSPRSRPIPSFRRSPSPRARPRSATIARPATAPAARAQKGYPNLTAGRWLWGGTLEEIDTTITHGIRAPNDADTHTSAMPAFGKDGTLKPEQIQQVVSYVRTLSGLEPGKGVDVAAGKKIFADNCAVCHGRRRQGQYGHWVRANLTTKVWQYGSDIKDLTYTVTNARNSTMPAWGGRLDPVTIKSLAVYVHSLGGGK